MKFIVGNWKTNPKKLEEAKKIVNEIKKGVKNAVKNGVQPIICPPNIYLGGIVQGQKGDILFGAQDVWLNNNEAETGEISANLYKNIGVKCVIVGHSECRARFDTNEIVSKKVINAVKSGLCVILCVGEEKRDKNGLFYNEVVNQLRESLKDFPENKLTSLMIAYEPVWAIGEDALSVATPKDFYEMAMIIRRTLAEQFKKERAFNVPLLYGGSVDKKNAESFIDIGADGLLIGRTSLKAKDFVSIIKTVIDKQNNNK